MKRSEQNDLRLSDTPLGDPTEILRRMPTQAITPALVELIDMLSGPILLMEETPRGKVIEMRPVKPRLAEAA